MQQDNRLNQHIGNVTTQVALQTQRDSASMFTLAVVTTVFLPPTFVAVRVSYMHMKRIVRRVQRASLAHNAQLSVDIADP